MAEPFDPDTFTSGKGAKGICSFPKCEGKAVFQKTRESGTLVAMCESHEMRDRLGPTAKVDTDNLPRIDKDAVAKLREALS